MTEQELREKLQGIVITTPGEHAIYTVLAEEIVKRIMPTITQYTEQSVANYQEELKDFAKDVLGQFGYSGSSGGLSTLEWAESIIKKGGKL